uniref:ChlorophyllIde b reductase n=1 Tax=Rhizophora mucronata TaxID=61149 RepID=A0A2P2LN60_RHIMU
MFGTRNFATTSAGSAKTLMKNLACFVVAPDMRRSVVTIPGCKPSKETGKQ